jgi:hypothetical protein
MNISRRLFFQFFDFLFDANSLDHHPGENLHQTNGIKAADKERGVHYLGFCLVGLKEFGAEISSRGNEDYGACPDENCGRAHLWAVKVPCHRPY